MKTAVSIPDEVFQQADALATTLGKSRSELITDALREHLRRFGDDAVTARLNAVYERKPLSNDDIEILDAYCEDVERLSRW